MAHYDQKKDTWNCTFKELYNEGKNEQLKWIDQTL